MSIFTSFFGHVAHLFEGTGKEVVTFLDSLADSIATNGGRMLIAAATNAVATAEATGGTGAEKFAAAKAAVVGDLAAQGIAVVENAVNGAIESAVAQHKTNVAAATAETAAAATATL